MTNTHKGFKNLNIKEDTSKKLAEMSVVFGKSQSKILSELIDAIYSIMNKTDSMLTFVIEPLDQKITIHIINRQLWRLGKLQEGMTRKQIEKLEREQK
jgi:predicted metalloprotease